MSRAPFITPGDFADAPPVEGGLSPWGRIDRATVLDTRHGRAIVHVSTPSHGGLWVPRPLLEHIPLARRAYAAEWSGSVQWYEEDVAAAAVLAAFPECFPSLSPADIEAHVECLDTFAARRGIR